MAKILSMAIALTMVLGVFAVLLPGMAAETPDAPSFADPERYDAGPELRSQTIGPVYSKVDSSGSMASPGAGGPGDYYVVNDTAPFLVLDDYWGFYAFELFKLRYSSDICEIWVGLDLNFTAGDPRNDWPRLEINDTNVQYAAEQFEDNIQPTEREYFGDPNPLDGSVSLLEEWGFDEAYLHRTTVGSKIMIMIANIKDANYYDSDYPYYIAGYFSPSIKLYYDRNVVTIDCWDWTNRTRGDTPRPFVYEDTLAHEYQHLLHDALDADEDSWINEGCSMYAAMLCGYGIPWSDINSFLFTPDNSLVEWGDQGDINILADYGQSALFMIYMNDHFGGADLISAIAHNTENGATSVVEEVAAMGYDSWDFNAIYRAFSLANFIRADSPGDGLYNYVSIDLNSPEAYPAWSFSLDPDWGMVSQAWMWGETYTILGYPTGTAFLRSYGTDYFQLYQPDWIVADPLLLKFGFDGMEKTPVGWEQTAKNALYVQNFNNEGVMPSDWSTQSDGPYDYPWFMAPDGGVDYHAEANSDDPGPGTDITEWLYMNTPIDATTATSLFLTFDLDYRSYDGDEFGQVLYATDDSFPLFYGLESWSSDFSGTVNLDLSAAAGNQVYLAFRYHGTWDWWMTVDDVVVTEVPGVVDDAWWSGDSDMRDVSLVGSADLTGLEAATLSFDTSYSIEEGWDFGFVQVSTDGGATWISLNNSFTTNVTDPSVHPDIATNLPGLTGSSGGWTSMSFDLSEWAGQEIMYRFRYMTDWASTWGGWYIDNVAINGVIVDDASDATSLEAQYPDTDFLITIYAPAQYTSDGLFLLPLVTTIDLNHLDETAVRSLSSMTIYDTVYIIVSSTLGPVDYNLGVLSS